MTAALRMLIVYFFKVRVVTVWWHEYDDIQPDKSVGWFKSRRVG